MNTFWRSLPDLTLTATVILRVTEISGFVLALMEIKFPTFARKVESTIDKAGSWLAREVPRMFRDYEFVGPTAFAPALVVGMTVLILEVLAFPIGFILKFIFPSVGDAILEDLAIVDFITFAGISILTPIVLTILWTAHCAIRFLNSFGGGNAIGTIGLMLSAIGLLVEYLML